VKVSAVAQEHRQIDAPARVFSSQDAFAQAFESGELNEDMVVVLPGQGPQAMGMPELHRLTPYLGVMQNRGLKVALLTDGRMSGASGKILAAIQVTPEASAGGLIGRIQTGDRVVINSETGELVVFAALDHREPTAVAHEDDGVGMGRELFQVFRDRVSSADAGASVVL
jgi:phosphogluconate dehydratase